MLGCQIRNEELRAKLLSALASQRVQLVPEALTAARHIRHGLSDKSLPEALAIACEIQDDWPRSNPRSGTLSALVPQLSRWAQVEPDMAYISWKQSIRAFSVRTRPAFLKDLSILIPFMLALAGEDRESVAVGVSQVMQEVCEWWP